jgi:hypothetical protein
MRLDVNFEARKRESRISLDMSAAAGAELRLSLAIATQNRARCSYERFQQRRASGAHEWHKALLCYQRSVFDRELFSLVRNANIRAAVRLTHAQLLRQGNTCKGFNAPRDESGVLVLPLSAADVNPAESERRGGDGDVKTDSRQQSLIGAGVWLRSTALSVHVSVVVGADEVEKGVVGDTGTEGADLRSAELHVSLGRQLRSWHRERWGMQHGRVRHSVSALLNSTEGKKTSDATPALMECLWMCATHAELCREVDAFVVGWAREHRCVCASSGRVGASDAIHVRTDAHVCAGSGLWWVLAIRRCISTRIGDRGVCAYGVHECGCILITFCAGVCRFASPTEK